MGNVERKGRSSWRENCLDRMALSFFILLRTSELFTEADGSVHAIDCSRGEDVAFNIISGAR